MDHHCSSLLFGTQKEHPTSQTARYSQFFVHKTRHVIMDSDSNIEWSGEEWNYKSQGMCCQQVAKRPNACLLIIGDLFDGV